MQLIQKNTATAFPEMAVLKFRVILLVTSAPTALPGNTLSGITNSPAELIAKLKRLIWKLKILTCKSYLWYQIGMFY